MGDNGAKLGKFQTGNDRTAARLAEIGIWDHSLPRDSANKQEASMTTDLILAILHHFLVFALAAIIGAELVLVRPGLRPDTLALVGRIDGLYGLIAMLIILVGAGRVLFGLKGWEFYVAYWAFWAKMAAFAIVGMLSIQPTIRFIRWRKAAAGDPAFAVSETDIRGVRFYLHAEAAVFVLIPALAAIMARGIGY
jgi:putative membrane protein